MIRIQRSRYENFVIDLASAYECYDFYLPAFMDFRGRIYRSGVLHFHERDLSRSLLVFSSNNEGDKYSTDTSMLRIASAFHYKKFESYDDADSWYKSTIEDLNQTELLELARDARDPFQFLSKVISLKEGRLLNQLPITQDASASAYQLMSYFLLDKELACYTNLITTKEQVLYDKHKIFDIYNFFKDELQDYIPGKLKDNVYEIVRTRLTRQLIKGIFMPLIYGKKVSSIKKDLYLHFGSLLNPNECNNLAILIEQFFKDRFPRITNLMTLVQNVGWFCSALDKPVFYGIPYYTTVQDYMMTESVNVWVFEGLKRKPRKLTLKIPKEPNHRDLRKTSTSTFANFIHQKDAGIAMHMIQMMSSKGAPVYTVHDNFITNIEHARELPFLYVNIFLRYDPLKTINDYINLNLRDGWVCQYPMDKPLPLDFLKKVLMDSLPTKFKRKKTYIDNVNKICSSYEYYIRTSFFENDELINTNIINIHPFLLSDKMKEEFKLEIDKTRRYLEMSNDNYSLHL